MTTSNPPSLSKSFRRPILPLLPILLLLLLLSALPNPAHASLDRLRKFQRQCFRDVIPCVMFMNEREPFGCAQCGEDSREEDVLEFTEGREVERFIRLGEADRRIIMLPEFIMYSRRVLFAMSSDPRNIAAVIVFEGPSPSSASATPIPFPPFTSREWSSDYQDPNRGFNFPDANDTDIEGFTQLERNAPGTGHKFLQYRFNIFRVNNSIAADIRNRTRRFAAKDQTPGPTSPRYKVQSNGQMFGCPSSPTPAPDPAADPDMEPVSANFTLTSAECLEQRTCLPMGGHSVWSALGHIDGTVPASERRFFAINAPMDSLAFFNDLALGSAAEIASLAAMLAVAEAVAAYRRGPGSDKPLIRQPVYFAWNAQSWGYAGSSRFMEDVTFFNCRNEGVVDQFVEGCVVPYMPSLKFMDFRNADITFLNIGQLISPQSRTNTSNVDMFYKHARRFTADNTSAGIELALDRAFARTDGVSLEDGILFLTPIDASQTFRQYREGADTFSVTNYRRNFTNTYFHSQYDNVTLIEGEVARRPLYNAARALALTVVDQAFNDTEAELGTDITINETIIDQVLTCMTTNWTECDLAREYLGEEVFERNSGNIIPGNSVGSFYPFTRLNETNPSGFAKLDLIRSFLAFHNRYEVEETEEACDRGSDCRDFRTDLNNRIRPQNHSELRATFCSRRTCVASDTFTHNAFGTGLTPTNDAQSSFKYIDEPAQPIGGDENTIRPAQAGWTESVWDADLGLCGFTEDTSLYGGLVLGAGIAIFLLSLVATFFFERAIFDKRASDNIERDIDMMSTQSPPPV